MPRPPDKGEDGFDEVHAEIQALKLKVSPQELCSVFWHLVTWLPLFWRFALSSTINRAPF
jgi:hypothetical protein